MLPVLNESIKYSTKIPSNSADIQFRPFLIKEEKVLLIAMESQDERVIINAIGDTVNACIADNVNVFDLPLFDLEYLFLQIRAKSVGETSEVKIGCSSCKHRNDVVIPLDEIHVKMPKVDRKINITNDVTLIMKFPSLTDILKTKAFDEQNAIEKHMETFYACLEAVETKDERFNIADESADEVKRFIESLTSPQFEKVKEFVDAIPTLKHTIKFTCESCGTENTRRLQGTSDFF